MFFSDTNPFVRYAQLLPTINEGDRFKAAYDYRIFYILNGTATFVIDDRQIDLHPGVVLFFRPGLFYRFIGNIKVIVLNFDLTGNLQNRKEAKAPDERNAFFPERIFENSPPEELRDITVVDHAGELEPLFRKCVSEFLCPTPYSDAMTSALTKEILCYIVQDRQNIHHDLPDVVRQVMLFLQENFDRDLKNGDIASEFGYHPFYLNRLFKAHTGNTLHKTLQDIRIRNAKILLTQTPLSIEEIIKESGFSDRTQFSIAFRKATGTSPSQFRKEFHE